LNSQNIVDNPAFLLPTFPKPALHLTVRVFNSSSKIVENMLRSTVSILFILFGLSAAAEVGDPKSRYSRPEYISMWKDVAIRQMQEHGIPASITLAQAILESGDGNSMLAREGNNHFGIKCHGWTGKKVYHDDDARNECFRKYRNADESFADHSDFLKRPRYAFLFDYDVDDYKSWAHGLKKAGYATNPKYPALLIRLIEENNLAAYDMEALGKMPKGRPASSPPPRSGKSDEIVVTIGKAGYKVSKNNIKYTETKGPETPRSLAEKLDMGPWQVRRYNDFEKKETIPAGTRVYLQPKRRKAAEAAQHIAVKGETLRDISQKYGVKMRRLRKKSGFDRGYEVKPGDKVILR